MASTSFVCVCAEASLRRALLDALSSPDVVYTTFPDEPHVIVVCASTQAAASWVRHVLASAESMMCAFVEQPGTDVRPPRGRPGPFGEQSNSPQDH
ncbi:hypothetical protein ACWDTI_01110 [Gordonia sp. NPDC003424]